VVDGGDTEDAVSVRSRGLIARIALPSSALLALKSAISFGSLGADICFTNTFIVRQQVQTLLVFDECGKKCFGVQIKIQISEWY